MKRIQFCFLISVMVFSSLNTLDSAFSINNSDNSALTPGDNFIYTITDYLQPTDTELFPELANIPPALNSSLLVIKLLSLNSNNTYISSGYFVLGNETIIALPENPILNTSLILPKGAASPFPFIMRGDLDFEGNNSGLPVFLSLDWTNHQTVFEAMNYSVSQTATEFYITTTVNGLSTELTTTTSWDKSTGYLNELELVFTSSGNERGRLKLEFVEKVNVPLPLSGGDVLEYYVQTARSSAKFKSLADSTGLSATVFNILDNTFIAVTANIVGLTGQKYASFRIKNIDGCFYTAETTLMHMLESSHSGTPTDVLYNAFLGMPDVYPGFDNIDFADYNTLPSVIPTLPMFLGRVPAIIPVIPVITPDWTMWEGYLDSMDVTVNDLVIPAIYNIVDMFSNSELIPGSPSTPSGAVIGNTAQDDPIKELEFNIGLVESESRKYFSLESSILFDFGNLAQNSFLNQTDEYKNLDGVLNLEFDFWIAYTLEGIADAVKMDSKVHLSIDNGLSGNSQITGVGDFDMELKIIRKDTTVNDPPALPDDNSKASGLTFLSVLALVPLVILARKKHGTR